METWMKMNRKGVEQLSCHIDAKESKKVAGAPEKCMILIQILPDSSNCAPFV